MITIREKEQFIEFIHNIAQERGIPISKIETQSNIGCSSIRRWGGTQGPSLNTMIQVLNSLELDLCIMERAESMENHDVVENGQEQVETEDIDLSILVDVYHIFKSASVADKEKLSKILKAFL